MRLNQDAVDHLPESIATPAYDRRAVSAGIVHVGVGGFHRAHEAVYVDRLLTAGESDWAICGVGLLPGDQRMRDVMIAQDCLYTLVERDADGGVTTRVVGSLVDYLYAPDDPQAVITRMAAPQTRIVSLTITEGGYLLRTGDGKFDADDPAVRRDLDSGGPPRTVFGLLVEALRLRRERGLAPFTVLSCDNLEENGEVARRAVQGFAQLRDPELAGWIREHVAFPNSMVDRITPATTAADRRFVADRLGIEDAWPVTCEPYLQWVLTDSFSAGRPAWENVGVTVVPDVRPYELMKLRLLNASHQVMGYLGSLAGLTYVHEACRDPDLVALLEGYMEREASPTLDPVPGVDLGDYRRSLLERFTNEAIADTLARQCVDGSERLPKFVLPVLRAQLASEGQISHTVLAIAGWARYAEGVDDQGRSWDVVDVRRDEIMAAAGRQHLEPTAMLSLAMFDGVRDDQRFVDAYTTALATLDEHGVRHAIRYLTG
jgi:mannitol 2-dehydrogenase